MDDAANKFRLLLGHIIQCTVQKRRIHRVFELTKEDANGSACVVVMDYNMKFEPILLCEKTTDFLCRKGLSWHGSIDFIAYTIATSNDPREGTVAKHERSRFSSIKSYPMRFDKMK